MARWKKTRTRFFIGAAAAIVLAVVGCSNDDDPSGPDGSNEIDALMIICNPLSPAPGELTQLTVQATGVSSGEWPSYYWTVQAGSLIVDEGLSVGWVAPEDPGVYDIAGPTTLLGALARAKSPTQVAALDEIVVFRTVNGQRMGARFDLRRIRNGLDPDPQILGGDVVVVGFDSLKGAFRDVLQAAPFFNVFAVLARN